MRGVNKLVIEVHPENQYFEKALIFLKPGKHELPQNKISDNAEKLLNDIENNKDCKKSKNGEPIFLLLIGITAGSAFSWLLFFAISLIS